MPILGYGEDALTMHALSVGIADVFRQLGDPTDPTASIRFFRPSFGRRSSRPGGSSRSLFGEFDGSQLELRSEQRRRHAAFRTYLEEWHRGPTGSWQDFAERIRNALAERTQGLVPPSAGTTLARNLEYVLRRLESCGPEIIDVLLFSRMSEAQSVPERCGEFCVVTHLSVPEEGSGFIRLME